MYTPRKSSIRGRPPGDETISFIHFLIDRIENDTEECQFSINQIQSEYGGERPEWTTIKSRLNSHFQNKIKTCRIKNDCYFQEKELLKWLQKLFWKMFKSNLTIPKIKFY